MKKLTKEEKHKQCVKEIRATLIVVGICFLWHVLTAFLLNSVDWTLFHMPAWFVVSVLGTVVIAIIGVFWQRRRALWRCLVVYIIRCCSEFCVQ